VATSSSARLSVRTGARSVVSVVWVAVLMPWPLSSASASATSGGRARWSR
jgi:hypothetical protein